MQADDEVVSAHVSRETSGADVTVLADRKRTGCLLRRGLACPCPATPYAYARCERIREVRRG